MTENEAIKYFKMATDEAGNEEFSDVYKEMCGMAIQALEKQSMVNEILNELREYSAIGTIDECRNAVEKMKPKKPVGLKGNVCPMCSWIVEDEHCEKCGQAIDLSE